MGARDWYERRTFHHDRFADLASLLRAKEEQGLSISVCIPTMNEEATIAGVAGVVREELMERVPLVDELAVIDGGSEDRTLEAARTAGADVYREQEILPDLPLLGGKGEALWRSLFVLRGDLIVWVDADVTDFHARFVYGLLGPLLEEPSVGYVKAFYDRPLSRDGSVDPQGGGRVTELVARPLLNLFWPDLAAVVQPLSGEYAGRRAVLETIPFLTGYAVELGLLVDVATRFGLEAIAQVDLDVRTHRNRGIMDLGAMAFAIIQGAMRRLEADGRVDVRTRLGDTLRQFTSSNGTREVRESRIEVVERPPAATVDAYPRGRR